MTTIAVIAKACLPGKVKTRLTPPLSPEHAAELASASLADSLDAVSATPATRRILFFEGGARDVPPEAHGYEVVPQPTGDLDVRLGHLFDLIDEPLLLVGMDTPQLTPELLAPALAMGGNMPDAWFGPARDGGFWALGMAAPDGSLIRGVGMSLDTTGAQQLERLEQAGLRIGILPELVDVDHIEEAASVAAVVPDGRFAAVFQSFSAFDPNILR
ncbi:DUF2064 domain-containing protein [Amnibacterium flavum]|uniref:Glycosyltransferase n=1 Tax=Amnibacterium flavum TaxID=2173173 RepID=A0A2V1HQQ3_9MICO|nr:DUF2064 domain-containing protein [Amnibacterium flavum]PVZ93459.1 glycosyltransferase [Amnibacterium flavum]